MVNNRNDIKKMIKNNTNQLDNQECGEKIINLYNDLKSSRSQLEKLWEQVITFVRPQKCVNPDGGKEIYDSTALLCAENLVSGLWSLINSSAGSWFYLKSSNNNNKSKTKKWLIDVGDILKNNLAKSESGFYYKSYEFYADLVCFGTAIFYMTENVENKQISYQPLNLMDTYLSKAGNNIDVVIRRINFSATEAVEFFGYDNVSTQIQESYKKGERENFIILHCVSPEWYLAQDYLKIKKMKFSSIYVELATSKVLLKSGYYEFPFMISRWSSNATQLYGQSPAMNVLADIKMLNAMSKSALIATQKMVDPPLLAPFESAIEGMKTLPGGIIYGGIDPISGNQLIKPLNLGGDLSNTYILQDQRRQSIKEAFYHSLLLYIYSNNATATEVLSINDQKIKILGSKIARIQSEFLYPLIKRQLHILNRLNLLPQDGAINIDDIEIEFISSFNMQHQLLNTIPLEDLKRSLHLVSEFYPQMVDSINWQELLKILAKNYNLPEQIFNEKGD